MMGYWPPVSDMPYSPSFFPSGDLLPSQPLHPFDQFAPSYSPSLSAPYGPPILPSFTPREEGPFPINDIEYRNQLNAIAQEATQLSQSARQNADLNNQRAASQVHNELSTLDRENQSSLLEHQQAMSNAMRQVQMTVAEVENRNRQAFMEAERAVSASERENADRHMRAQQTLREVEMDGQRRLREAHAAAQRRNMEAMSRHTRLPSHNATEFSRQYPRLA
eukprot:NODE_4322_length_807_cov_18.225000_g4164_i0.p1 GENE.NODE_4322_length_807_cov_18.225000_g4164_i0~~NODE_4322_length_807_cov_18.225000_g4164_i0.p1  ORF type:complete len:239 (-),score=42.09 NODE_4322_length_807_cov_18.225000_g4164_i0:91-753(-)